jgi:hypothetical protein
VTRLSRFAFRSVRQYVAGIDLTAKINIARTRERIPIHKTVIATVERKGGDASEYGRQLEAERYLASGCAPPKAPEAHTRAEGTAVGYIMPPSAK